MLNRTVPIQSHNLSQSDLGERLSLIRTFSARSEREPAFVFKGRDSIRAEVKESLNRLHSSTSSEGFLSVIQGAPGAGKTSLLHQLERELGGNGVVAIRTHSNTLNYPTRLLIEFVVQLGGSRQEITQSLMIKKSGRLGVSGTGVVGEQETRQQPRSETVGELGIWNQLLEMFPNAKDTRFLLLVDETQAQRRKLSESFKELVQELSSGTTGGIRVLALFAGLNDSRDTLESCELTRMLAPIQLGSLTEAEAIAVVRESLNSSATGLSGLIADEDVEAVAYELALASEGWPHHLHLYLKAFAYGVRECLEQNVAEPHVDFDAALDRGHINRHSYYGDRIDHPSVGRDMKVALLNWMKANPHESSFTANSLLDYMPNGDKLDGEQRDTEIANAVHAGVFQPLSKRMGPELQYEFAIPSMKTYLSCEGREDAMVEALRRVHEKQLLGSRLRVGSGA